MSKFTANDSWDVDRCMKHVKIQLSREEVAFCLEQCGRTPKNSNDGGGTIVDEYLTNLLRSALEAEMLRGSPST